MNTTNNNEVPNIPSSVPQINKSEPEVSSAPLNNNYTSNKQENQDTNDIISNLKFPVNDSIPTSFRNNKGKLDTYSLAEQLMKDYHIIRIESDNKLSQNMLYLYNNGIYEYDMQKLESAIRRLGRGAKTSEIKSTFENLLAMAPIKEESSYVYVAFNNCIVNFKTLETFDFDYDKYVITSKVYADYNVDIDISTIQLVDRFFSDITCGDTELQQCLFEILGYCMLRTAKYQRAFILHGNANNR